MVTIEMKNTSSAWLRALEHLLDCGGECFNMMVCIENPTQTEPAIQQAFEQMLSKHGLLNLKQVVYTIFPWSLYKNFGKNPDKLFEIYNRKDGVYDRLRKYPRFGWGSYFRRMTYYPSENNQGNPVTVNQLNDIITMLRNRQKTLKARYTILIQIPGRDMRRVIGGPCLDHIALQLTRSPKQLNLLAIYRNHDFVQRAYGNYLALGYLMQFLCEQTGYTLGTLNCLSSHADINNMAGASSWPGKAELRKLVRSFNQS